MFLQCAPKRPGPIGTIATGTGNNPLYCLGCYRDLYLLVPQVLIHLFNQEAHNLSKVVVTKGVENDDFVDPVDEFRVERLFHLP